jgi:hypothetical protein
MLKSYELTVLGRLRPDMIRNTAIKAATAKRHLNYSLEYPHRDDEGKSHPQLFAKKKKNEQLARVSVYSVYPYFISILLTC